MASGCAPFYNTCKEGTSNTKMTRDFKNDTFEIHAVRDIEKDEELLHVSFLTGSLGISHLFSSIC